MRKRSIVLGAIISVLILIGLTVFLVIYGPNIKIKKKITKAVIEESKNVQESNKSDKVLVANLNSEEEEEEEPEPDYRDAARTTQDLQELDIDIGFLNISKTGLETKVYCKQNANKMEEVPCMLYTNQGPNQPGATIFVGHNRNNGLLFSDNKLIEENDEIYFTDYINNEEKKYIVTSKFVTNSTDVSFYNEQSEKPILYMQCCLTPTDTENVLIIKAIAE